METRPRARTALPPEGFRRRRATLRLPLANEFAYYKSYQVFSGLRLLKDGLFALRLNLAGNEGNYGNSDVDIFCAR